MVVDKKLKHHDNLSQNKPKFLCKPFTQNKKTPKRIQSCYEGLFKYLKKMTI